MNFLSDHVGPVRDRTLGACRPSHLREQGTAERATLILRRRPRFHKYRFDIRVKESVQKFALALNWSDAADSLFSIGSAKCGD